MIRLGFVGPFQLLIVGLILLLPLFALIDILKNDFNGSDKLIWVLIVILFPILGAILYFLIGSSKKIKK